jgi:hypothetical protein
LNLVETNKENIMRLRTQGNHASRQRKHPEETALEPQTAFEPKTHHEISHRAVPFCS